MSDENFDPLVEPNLRAIGAEQKVAELESDKERMISEFVIENGKRHELESALASERAARTVAEATIAAALAAHKAGPSGFDKAHVGALRVYEILAAAPSTALDAHDAQVKAEALEEAADDILHGRSIRIRDRAAEIRKAAQ